MKQKGLGILPYDQLDRLFQKEIDWLNLQPKFEKQILDSISGSKYIEDNEDFVLNRINDVGFLGYVYQVQIHAGLDNQTIDELNTNEDWNLFNYYNGLWISIANDLFSIHKEIGNLEYHRNFIYITMMNRKISGKEAFRILEHEILDCIKKIEIYSKKLEILQNESINRYKDWLVRLHYGAMYWQSIALRYKKNNKQVLNSIPE